MMVHVIPVVVWCVPGSRRWFVLKNLNAASSFYYVRLRAINGLGAGPASSTVTISTALTGLTPLINLHCES